MYSNNVIGSGNATASGVIFDQSIVAPDVPRISHEMATIQKLINEHGEIATRIEERLRAVLRPASATGDSQQAASAPRPSTSPMTCDLEGFRLQLAHVQGIYSDILNRLEI